MTIRQTEGPKDIIVIGSIPLALKVVRYFHGHRNVHLAGVICEKITASSGNDLFSDISVYGYARECSIPFITIEDIEAAAKQNRFYLAVSARAPYILKQAFLGRFKKGIINMHGGLLPEMRGVNNANHAILDDWGYSGGTLHYMDSDIDTGPIIARRKFIVGPHDTAHDVFRMTQSTLWQLFLENIEAVLDDCDSPVPQEELIVSAAMCRYYNSKSIDQKRKLQLTLGFEEIHRRARGYDFPGHEPAFFEFGDIKTYATTQEAFCFFCDSPCFNDLADDTINKNLPIDSSMRALSINMEPSKVFENVLRCDLYGLLPAYLEEDGKRVYLTTKKYFCR